AIAIGLSEQRTSESAAPSPALEAQAQAEDAVAIGRAADGHFWVDAEVNGEPVRFLVDTGASHVILSMADAEQVGFDLREDDYTSRYETANGTMSAAPVV